MRKSTILLVLGGMIVIGCLGYLAFGPLLSSSPTYKAIATMRVVAQASKAARPTATLQPTDTPVLLTLTPIPAGTPVLTPMVTPVLPIDLQGTGPTATREFALPSPISVARFTHNGTGNFMVKVFQGNEQDLLIHTIGSYEGERPLIGDEPVMLDILADGAWTVHIEPILITDSPSLSGRGDSVGDVFMPPGTRAWEIMHNGTGNFIVYLHCVGGSELIQSTIGAVQDSTVIKFPNGPCFWEVRADGDWSLNPQP